MRTKAHMMSDMPYGGAMGARKESTEEDDALKHLIDVRPKQLHSQGSQSKPKRNMKEQGAFSQINSSSKFPAVQADAATVQI